MGTPARQPGNVQSKNYWGDRFQIDPGTGNPERLSPIVPQGNADLDYWSTAPPVLPEAPTGGLYGIYNSLAAGTMSPDEAALGQTIMAKAAMPASPIDVNLYNSFRAIGDNASAPEAQQRDIYSGMVGQGYSPEELAAINQAGMDSTRAGLGTARAEIERRVRSGGGTSGGYGAMADLGIGGTNALAKQARDTQILNAQEKERRTEAAATGLGANAALVQGRQQPAYAAMSDLLKNVEGRQTQYMSLAQNQQAAQRANQQAGVKGLQGLYDSTSAQASGAYQSVADLLKNPREIYTTGN